MACSLFLSAGEVIEGGDAGVGDVGAGGGEIGANGVVCDPVDVEGGIDGAAEILAPASFDSTG